MKNIGNALKIIFWTVFPFASLCKTTHKISPTQSIQCNIDRSTQDHTIVLNNDIYYETITITKTLTIKAKNPGVVVIANKYKGHSSWAKANTGSQVWYETRIN